MEYIINAENRKLGRLATNIALILQGKLNAKYNPRLAGSDRVTVQNVGKIVFERGKYQKKIYYQHTGYMGHLRKKTLRTVFEKSPETVLKKAVFNMLPKNRLRAKRMNRLVFK